MGLLTGVTVYRPGDTYHGLLFDAGEAPSVGVVRNGADDPAFALTVSALAAGRWVVSGVVPSTYAPGDVVQVWSAERVVSEFVVQALRLEDLPAAVWANRRRTLSSFGFRLAVAQPGAVAPEAPGAAPAPSAVVDPLTQTIVGDYTVEELLLALAAVHFGDVVNAPDHSRTDFYDLGDKGAGRKPRVSSANTRTSRTVVIRRDE